MTYLCLAHVTILRNTPDLTSDSLGSIKEVIRVVLGLDSQQGIILVTKKGRLEVWLSEIRLVHVRTRTRSHLLDSRHDGIRHEILVGQHLVPLGRLKRPDGSQRRVDQGVSPGGEHTVLVVGREAAHVRSHTDKRHALLGDEAEGLVEIGGVDGRTGDQTTTVLGDTDINIAIGEGSEVGVVVVVVVC